MVTLINLKLQETKGSRKIPFDAPIGRKCDGRKLTVINMNFCRPRKSTRSSELHFPFMKGGEDSDSSLLQNLGELRTDCNCFQIFVSWKIMHLKDITI